MLGLKCGNAFGLPYGMEHIFEMFRLGYIDITVQAARFLCKESDFVKIVD